MHVSKIYLQDNFVPDVFSDQFRRKVFGIEITIGEKENAGDAILEAENQIKNYIKANTVQHSDELRGTIIRDLEPSLEEMPLIDQIRSCKELKVLESYKLIVRNDEELNNAYRTKLIELSNQDQ
jgi:hypothetical protein